MRLRQSRPETLIAQVRQGDRVDVALPSLEDDRRYPAVVSEVGTRAGAGNAFPVRVDLVDAPPGVRPGPRGTAPRPRRRPPR